MMWIIALVIVTAIVISIMVYWSNSHWSIKAIALAIFLAVGVLQLTHYKDMLGHPISGYPEDEFMYVAHTYTSDDMIQLWATTVKLGNRLYSFPYSRDIASDLQDAERKTDEGEPQTGKFRNGTPGISMPGVGFTPGRVSDKNFKIKPKPSANQDATNGP